MFAAEWRRPLVIGVALAVLQQLTGINAIIYYADQIFAAAGFTSPTSQSLATLWAVGAVNVVATFVAVVWVDRFGRKPLLFIGTTGMGLSLVVVGAMFLELPKVAPGGTPHATTGQGLVTLVALVVFIASFAFSLGPIVWTIINEIFPSHVRGKAVAVATAANWFAAWLVAQFFLTLVSLITTTGVFWVFAGFCAVTLLVRAALRARDQGAEPGADPVDVGRPDGVGRRHAARVARGVSRSSRSGRTTAGSGCRRTPPSRRRWPPTGPPGRPRAPVRSGR